MQRFIVVVTSTANTQLCTILVTSRPKRRPRVLDYILLLFTMIVQHWLPLQQS